MVIILDTGMDKYVANYVRYFWAKKVSIKSHMEDIVSVVVIESDLNLDVVHVKKLMSNYQRSLIELGIGIRIC